MGVVSITRARRYSKSFNSEQIVEEKYVFGETLDSQTWLSEAILFWDRFWRNKIPTAAGKMLNIQPAKLPNRGRRYPAWGRSDVNLPNLVRSRQRDKSGPFFKLRGPLWTPFGPPQLNDDANIKPIGAYAAKCCTRCVTKQQVTQASAALRQEKRQKTRGCGSRHPKRSAPLADDSLRKWARQKMWRD